MINLIAPINSLGYGVVGLNITKSLSRKAEVSLWPISQPQVSTQEDAEAIQATMDNSRTPDWNAPCIRIWHQHDMSQFVGHGLKVGFPIFELDTFSSLEKHHLGHLDKIFVCSEWAKQVVVDTMPHAPHDVHVIPLGVDSRVFPRSPIDNDQNHGTIFFNCGKWEVRKGHDLISKAFNKAFEPEDDVQLHMMCDNPFCDEKETYEWQSLYKNSKLGEKVKLIGRVESSHDVYNIMSKVDCGVFPSRSEGWNLEALELLSCGKHVIATDYSGHTEFCTKENAHLVTIDKKEKAFDGKWFDGKTGSWAHLGSNQIDQIVEHMRKIHKSKQEGSLKTNEAGIKTAQKLSWDSSAEKILSSV
tara:strand:- start:2034 stop:3107 length:1074 start_codon:yes stop_codon:yes gene_type:complete